MDCGVADTPPLGSAPLALISQGSGWPRTCLLSRHALARCHSHRGPVLHGMRWARLPRPWRISLGIPPPPPPPPWRLGLPHGLGRLGCSRRRRRGCRRDFRPCPSLQGNRRPVCSPIRASRSSQLLGGAGKALARARRPAVILEPLSYDLNNRAHASLGACARIGTVSPFPSSAKTT